MSKRRREGFKCECCGKWHDHELTDMGFQLPDAGWSMPRKDQEVRLVANDDFCIIHKRRYFIRCVVLVPFTKTKGDFGWGLWAEVSKRDFFRYHDNHRAQGAKLKPFPGRVANALPGYLSVFGKPVEVRPGSRRQRPTLHFPSASRHLLAREQRTGIDVARHHELLHENMPHDI